MAKKLTSEQESNLNKAKKLLKAGHILDLYLWQKGKDHKAIEVQFSSVRKFKKSQSLDFHNHFTTKTGYYQEWEEYEYPPGTWSWSARKLVNKTGVRDVGWGQSTAAGVMALKKIRDYQYLHGIGPSNLDKAESKTVALVTDEDVQWARSVFDNESIDYSDLSLAGKKYTVTFIKTVDVKFQRQFFADDADHAAQIQGRIIDGSNPVTFHRHEAHWPKAILESGIPGTDVAIESITEN